MFTIMPNNWNAKFVIKFMVETEICFGTFRISMKMTDNSNATSVMGYLLKDAIWINTFSMCTKRPRDSSVKRVINFLLEETIWLDTIQRCTKRPRDSSVKRVIDFLLEETIWLDTIQRCTNNERSSMLIVKLNKKGCCQSRNEQTLYRRQLKNILGQWLICNKHRVVFSGMLQQHNRAICFIVKFKRHFEIIS